MSANDVGDLCNLVRAVHIVADGIPQRLCHDTYFVVNNIAYVQPFRDEADSSEDEDPDADFERVDYRPFENPSSEFIPLRRRDAQRDERLNTKSRVVIPFLRKLWDTGVEEYYRKERKVSEISAVAVLLNRMRSLSTRRNQALAQELLCDTSECPIRHRVIAAYWTCKWHVEGRKSAVEYETVRRYYKKLKRHNKREAQALLDRENTVKVPYRLLREALKNHDYTRGLVTDWRNSHSDANIYLAFFDCDTFNFNGVLSTYLRKVASCERPPEVMTTGYEFPMDDQYGPFFKIGSGIDRHIRLILANVHPLFPYYPEPNLCVLVKPNEDTVTASFEPKAIRKDAESPALLKNLQAAGYERFSFFAGEPLITAIPRRARKLRGRHLKYSANSANSDKTDDQEFTYYQFLCQSHFKPFTRYGIFFVNFTGRKPARSTCTQVLAKFGKCYEDAKSDEEDYYERAKDPVDELIELGVPNELAESISSASFDVLHYLSQLRASYSRTNAETFAEFLAVKETIFSRLVEFDSDLLSLLDAFRGLAPTYVNYVMSDCYDEKNLLRAQETNPGFPKLMRHHPTEVVYQNSDDNDVLRYWFRNFGDMIDFAAVFDELERERDPSADAFRKLWEEVCPSEEKYGEDEDARSMAYAYCTKTDVGPCSCNGTCSLCYRPRYE